MGEGTYEVTIISYAALLGSISLFKLLKQNLVRDIKSNILMFSVQMFKLFFSKSDVCKLYNILSSGHIFSQANCETEGVM